MITTFVMHHSRANQKHKPQKHFRAFSTGEINRAMILLTAFSEN